MKRNISFATIFAFALLVFFPGLFGLGDASAQSIPTKPLTIESMFQTGGLLGRGPETVEWSPDGSKLTFVQRDEKGEKGELWYMDTATGEKKVLVSAAKLASLDPDVNKVKNEREKERLTRYHVAAYLWAPDSKHMIFDSRVNCGSTTSDLRRACNLLRRPIRVAIRSFLPTEAASHTPGSTTCMCKINGKNEKQLTKDTGENFFNGDIDWVYAEELGVRSNYFWSPDNREIVFLRHGRDEGADLSHYRLDADASDGGSGEVSKSWRSEPGRKTGSGDGQRKGPLDFADQRRGYVYSALWMGAGGSALGRSSQPDRRQNGSVLRRCEIGEIANRADGNDSRSVD